MFSTLESRLLSLWNDKGQEINDPFSISLKRTAARMMKLRQVISLAKPLVKAALVNSFWLVNWDKEITIGQ